MYYIHAGKVAKGFFLFLFVSSTTTASQSHFLAGRIYIYMIMYLLKDMPFDLGADENPSERKIEFPVIQWKEGRGRPNSFHLLHSSDKVFYFILFYWMHIMVYFRIDVTWSYILVHTTAQTNVIVLQRATLCIA